MTEFLILSNINHFVKKKRIFLRIFYEKLTKSEGRKKLCLWKQSDVDKALQDVRSRGIPFVAAARDNNVRRKPLMAESRDMSKMMLKWEDLQS